MDEMIDYFSCTERTSREITEAIKGKTIIDFQTYDMSGDDFMRFLFDDNSYLIIRYDWVYEWAIRNNGK